MKPGRPRKAWRKDLPFRVPSYSVWRRRRAPAELWKVTALFHFEVGSGKPMRAVRIHCFEGEYPGTVLHMSEERFLRGYRRLFAPRGT